MDRPATLPALLAALAVAGAALPAAAAAQGFEQHGAHVHDAGTLDVALEGRRLSVALTAPAVNVVGFERPPRTAAEREAVAAANALLAAPARLFTMNAAAGCRTVARKVEPPEHGDHDHDHDHGHAHADYRASWEFDCARPEALTFLDAGPLLANLRGAVTLEAALITAERQSAARLRAGASRLALR